MIVVTPLTVRSSLAVHLHLRRIPSIGRSADYVAGTIIFMPCDNINPAVESFDRHVLIAQRRSISGSVTPVSDEVPETNHGMLQPGLNAELPKLPYRFHNFFLVHLMFGIPIAQTILHRRKVPTAREKAAAWLWPYSQTGDQMKASSATETIEKTTASDLFTKAMAINQPMLRPPFPLDDAPITSIPNIIRTDSYVEVRRKGLTDGKHRSSGRPTS
jgi:hypothetical protein